MKKEQKALSQHFITKSSNKVQCMCLCKFRLGLGLGDGDCDVRALGGLGLGLSGYYIFPGCDDSSDYGSDGCASG